MSHPGAETIPIASKPPGLAIVIIVLGLTQILAWGSSYYLLAVLANALGV